MPSFILISPTVWRQFTNVTDYKIGQCTNSKAMRKIVIQLCTADAVMTTTTEETTTAVVATTVETTALPTTTIDETTTFQPITTVEPTTTLATTTPSEYNCIILSNSICVGIRIRCDTIQCTILTCSQKLANSQLCLPYRTTQKE